MLGWLPLIAPDSGSETNRCSVSRPKGTLMDPGNGPLEWLKRSGDRASNLAVLRLGFWYAGRMARICKLGYFCQICIYMLPYIGKLVGTEIPKVRLGHHMHAGLFASTMSG